MASWPVQNSLIRAPGSDCKRFVLTSRGLALILSVNPNPILTLTLTLSSNPPPNPNPNLNPNPKCIPATTAQRLLECGRKQHYCVPIHILRTITRCVLRLYIQLQAVLD